MLPKINDTKLSATLNIEGGWLWNESVEGVSIFFGHFLQFSNSPTLLLLTSGVCHSSTLLDTLAQRLGGHYSGGFTAIMSS